MVSNFRYWSIILIGLLFFVSVFDPTSSQDNLSHLINLATPLPTLTPTLKITPMVLTTTNPTDSDLVRFVSIEQIGINPSATKKLTRQDTDVTGDGQVDILLGGTTYDGWLPFLAIFSRPADNYPWQIIFYSDDPGKYWADIRVSVDGNHMIADFLTANGGTGVIDVVWRQRWIECQSDRCTIIWEKPILQTWRYTNPISGMISRGYQISEFNQVNSESIGITTQEFALENVPFDRANESGDYRLIDTDRTHWVVGPNVEQVYQLNNGLYELVDEKLLSSSFEIIRQYDQQTNATLAFLSDIFAQDSNSYGEFKEARAHFWGLPAPDESSDPIWGGWYRKLEAAASDGFQNGHFITEEATSWVGGVTSAIDRPLCRLTVQHYSAMRFELVDRIELPCIGNLTRLEHADVNDDGQDELLLLTIPPDDLNADTQRLHIFSVDKELVELAKFDGFINGADMVGVRWEQNEDSFRVFTGLPLIDLNCQSRTWSCVTLGRHFHTYEWQADTETFQLASEE